VDPKPLALGQHEQLGVEEPPVVAHAGQKLACDVGAHRLEAALGVAEARGQGAVQKPVVGPRDQLTPRSAGDPRAGAEAGPDREVAVA